jgi:tetratricopeptide (TPR) repeat protein
MSFMRLAVAAVFVGGLTAFALCQAAGPDYLASRPLPPHAGVKSLAVGEEVRTAAGERRRLEVASGVSVLLNEKTILKRTGERALELTAGEVFVAAAIPGEGVPPLAVQSPRRVLKVTTGRFAVRTAGADSRVLATAGQVQVNGLAAPLTAGQQLNTGEDRPSTAPRVTHLLSWTRDLLTDGMVPASGHQGGSLVILDPNGQEERLALRRYHVDIHIEDGFARTTIDQTYFNHTHSRQEGTFRFPLPADASLSRLAMYSDGRLNEGGMVERDFGRMVYRRIVHEQRDPALLEWVDGSTFSLRVFPLEPRQEKRLLLSYTQRLGSLHGLSAYRFPAGHDLTAGQFSAHVRIKGGAKAGWRSDSHAFKASTDGDDLLLDTSAKDARIERDVVLEVAEVAGDRGIRFSSAEQDGSKYLMLRWRPELPRRAARSPRDWIFLFESSGDRDPLLARTQIEIIRAMLQAAGPEDRMNLVIANTRQFAMAFAGPVPLTPERITQAIEILERAHLVGALDLGEALRLDSVFGWRDVKDPWLVHVGSGIAAMGQRRNSELVKCIPAGTHYVGIGVGRRWNRSLMKLAAEKTGGYFTQINPDEPVAWRAFDLAATLDTPRLLDVQVTDRDGKVMFLPFTSVVAQGEELAAVARLDGVAALPETVVVSGTLDGEAYRQELKVEGVKAKADYLPRTWAKLEIDRLLAEDAAKNKERIIAWSKAMCVMTPYTSLLVLENEEMYQQFKVDRGRKDHWALYPAPERIEVVSEPEDGPPFDPRKGIKPSPEQVLKTLLVREQRAVIGVASASPPSDEAPVSFPPAATWVTVSDDASRIRDYYGYDGHSAKSGRAPGMSPVETQILARAIVLSGSEKTKRGEILREARAPATVPSLPDPHPSGGTPDIQEQSAELAPPEPDRRHLYTRPGYREDDRLYFDLVACAPGLNTTAADHHAVVEQEAAPSADGKLGAIDEGARQLLDRAREGVWRSLTRPSDSDWTITFDGTGSHIWDRRLPSGLHEQVVCDGRTLWHIYPELGLAARRKLSRFHRQAFTGVVPWVVPPAEDLARGADLRLRDENTVAIVPHGGIARSRDGKPQPQRELQLVFSKDGNLASRRVVEMPSRKVIFQEELTPDGMVRRLDGDGKEVAVIRGTLSPAKAPVLKPDVTDLVVLPLPYRTVEHVRKTLGIEKKGTEALTFDEGRALLAASFAAGNGDEAMRVFRECFHRRDQRQIGFYVLLASCGQNLDAEHVDILAEHRDSPLAQYLALYTSPVLRKHASQWAAASNSWGEGFLGRLVAAHSLCQYWSDPHIDVAKRQHLERALGFVRKHKGTAFGWAVLSLIADMAAAAEHHDRPVPAVHRALTEVWPLFADVPALRYSARYEHARSLWKAGEGKRAAKLFLDLYEETMAAGALPPIDRDFRACLLEAGIAEGAWSELLRRTTDRLVKKKEREALLALARQCWQIGDAAASQQVYDMVRESLSIGKDQVPLLAVVLDFLEETGQLTAADELLQAFLGKPALARDPRVLRRAYQLAHRRDLPRLEQEYLERLLDAEFQDLPEVVDLESVRREYGDLLHRYESQAKAMQALGIAVPGDFKDRVIRTADRWRALDRDHDEPCQLAAGILRILGENTEAWDYLTTPIGQRPNDAAAWVSLASSLAKEGEWALADNAYAAAAEADPTNAAILWDRAHNLTQAGRLDLAAPLYRRLAEGRWAPEYRGLQEQARSRISKR